MIRWITFVLHESAWHLLITFRWILCTHGNLNFTWKSISSLFHCKRPLMLILPIMTWQFYAVWCFPAKSRSFPWLGWLIWLSLTVYKKVEAKLLQTAGGHVYKLLHKVLHYFGLGEVVKAVPDLHFTAGIGPYTRCTSWRKHFVT